MKLNINFFTLFLCLFCLQWLHTSSQQVTVNTSNVNPNSITNSVGSLETLGCNCDVTARFCDDKCCCDTYCSDSIISSWKQQNLCQDKEFIYSTSTILPCSQSRPKTIDDLRSGLRIYYQILKIFFCVVFDNSKDKDRFEGYKSNSEINQAKAVVASSSVTTSSSQVQIQRTSFQDLTLKRPTFGSSLCSDHSVSYFNNMESKSCFFVASAITDFCAAGTFADPSFFQTLTFRTTTSGSTTLAVTPRAVYSKSSSTIGYTSLDLTTFTWTTPTSDATACTCANFISEIHYQLVVDETGTITNGTYDLVIVQSAQTFTGCTSNQILVPQTTSFFFVNSLTSGPRVKGPGYRMGDPLVFGGVAASNSTNTVIETFADPLSFTYLTSAGACASTSESFDETKRATVEFGYNHIFSCPRGTAANICSTRNYNNIATNFAYISKFPNGNVSYQSDWVAVGTSSLGASSCSSAEGIQISIFYSAVGTRNDAGYRINSASASFIDDTFSASSSEYRIYVNFIPLPQSPKFFVAPNPTASVSMPDNVLTPFVNSRG